MLHRSTIYYYNTTISNPAFYVCKEEYRILVHIEGKKNYSKTFFCNNTLSKVQMGTEDLQSTFSLAHPLKGK